MGDLEQQLGTSEHGRWIRIAVDIALVVGMAVAGAVGVAAALGVALLVQILRTPFGGVC